MLGEKILYLSRADVENLEIPMGDVVNAVEAAFLAKGNDEIEMPAKLGIHTQPNAFSHAMPAYIKSSGAAGMKWVSAYSGNKALGLPYISGLIILIDEVSGIPVALLDNTWVTAKRTAAASGVGARYLARKDSHVLAILGLGVQGFTHLEAMLEVLPDINKLLAYDPDPKQVQRYIKKVKTHFPELAIEAMQSPESAVKASEVVVTAGPILSTPHATIKQGWLKAGSFAAAVDYDSYWSSEAMHEMDKFCTDDVEAMLSNKEKGSYFAGIPEIYGDLGEIVSGKKAARTSDSEKTMTCNLGIAINDIAVAHLVYQQAKEQGAGQQLQL
jgi:ornithine cyclodeaminase/alanine dehydrogenase-like protein (mu-crystallin family)